jgi:tRNA wybutosine-synthesizing protein 2
MPSRTPPDFRTLLKETLRIPESKHAYLPSGFQRIGHVVILNLRPEILGYSRDIAELVLSSYPYARTVCLSGGVSGELREPRIRYIAGNRNTETTYRENRCRFRLDVSKAMLSKGNLSERARLPGIVRPGETVADLFAGIGYFSIPIARHSRPGKVYSIEKNPVSFGYLKENVRLNRVQETVTPVLGDCMEVNLGKVADRVIMGYLPRTHAFLATAFSFLKPSGGTIHYHDTFRKDELWDKPLRLLESRGLTSGYSMKSASRKSVVKEYAPGVRHIVIDAEFVMA